MLQEESSRITTQATGAISWRRPDVKYKKNEAFVDVVETVNLIMSAKGVQITKTLLSGVKTSYRDSVTR